MRTIASTGTVRSTCFDRGNWSQFWRLQRVTVSKVLLDGLSWRAPEPPRDLADRSPLLSELTPGTAFSRIHCRNEAPVFFGKTGRNRFDSPNAKFGVLYVGLDVHCAFIETFGQSAAIRTVTRRALDQRHLSYLKIAAPLTLIDLAGRVVSRASVQTPACSVALTRKPNPGRRLCAIIPQSQPDFSILRGTMLLGRL